MLRTFVAPTLGRCLANGTNKKQPTVNYCEKKHRSVKYASNYGSKTLKDFLGAECFSCTKIFSVKKQPPEVFCEKGALRNFTKFTGKHLCQNLFFNKVAGHKFHKIHRETPLPEFLF